MIFVRKFNKIPEFYMTFARKVPEFYTILPPLPLPPVSSYAYVEQKQWSKQSNTVTLYNNTRVVLHSCPTIRTRNAQLLSCQVKQRKAISTAIKLTRCNDMAGPRPMPSSQGRVQSASGRYHRFDGTLWLAASFKYLNSTAQCPRRVLCLFTNTTTTV